MEFSNNKNLTIRLTALTIVVVSALTFTAFAESKDSSADSEDMSLTDLDHISTLESIHDSNSNEISYGVTSRDPQGFVWMDDLADLKRMHEVYHTTLKGNGFYDDVMAKVGDLPIRVKERKIPK